jgi:uncharacterized protein (DUF302 family)
MADAQMPDIVEHASPHSFPETVKRLTAAMTQAGLTVFASIDHADNARRVGMAMPPATVLIYGNAKGGTPVMLGTPQAALDLPLRVLIAARLEPAQRLLLTAIDSH